MISLIVLVGKDGLVENLEVRKGHP